MVMDFNPNPPTMRWLLMIGFGLLYMNMIHSHSVTYDLPCHFLDSINITAGVRQTNGSILYDGILFANGQYSNVNYTLEYGKKHIPTDSHIRGCLCTYNRTCLRFCNEAAKTDFEHEILNAQNQSETVKLNKQFTIIDHHPCEEMFIADKYQIKHNGDILLENISLNHKEYCFEAASNKETNRSDLKLMVCYDPDPFDWIEANHFDFLSYGMLLSVLFLVITILIYSLIPKLRDLHGKCLICYSVVLAIGFSTLALVQVHSSAYVEKRLCYFAAYVIYYSLLSAYFWMNVLNFDLWLSYQSSSYFHRFTESKLFILYAVYGFGCPCPLTVTMYILDSIESLPQHLQPGLGVESCFLKGERTSILLFFELPLIIMFIINIILFISTALKMSQSQQSSSNEFNSRNEKFKIYLRLFIVMGISWTLNAISFVIVIDWFITLVDICNTLYGLFIFVLFVLKRSVLRLIKERWDELFGRVVPYGNITRRNRSESFETLNSVSFST